MRKKFLFLDGKMVKADIRLLDSLVPGSLKRQGAFETMRVCDGKIADLKEHLGRLGKGLKLLGMRAPYSQKQLEQYLYRTLEVNALRQARVRLAVWRESRHLRTAIVCEPFKGYPGEKYKKGFKAVSASVQRKKTRLSHIKSLDYGVFREAFLEAKNLNCDEAILLNTDKEIVEGSRTNIFFARKDILYTPAVQCGALNGITRQQVICCARKEKIPYKAVAAGLRRLLEADEAFVTNSLMGVMPLTIVNGRRIGSGRIGVITRRLLSAYCKDSHSSCPAQGKSV